MAEAGKCVRGYAVILTEIFYDQLLAFGDRKKLFERKVELLVNGHRVESIFLVYVLK